MVESGMDKDRPGHQFAALTFVSPLVWIKFITHILTSFARNLGQDDHRKERSTVDVPTSCLPEAHFWSLSAKEGTISPTRIYWFPGLVVKNSG
jgi:hypothetical protein